MEFKNWFNLFEDELLKARLEDEPYDVHVNNIGFGPHLQIDGIGEISLYLNSENDKPYYNVNLLKGLTRGAGTVLYFAALEYILRHGLREANGKLASDTIVSSDAIRARKRIQDYYGEYLYILTHPVGGAVRVHNWSSDTRVASSEEATMWRLKKLPPFTFNFIE